jgi:hypothetical protein
MESSEHLKMRKNLATSGQKCATLNSNACIGGLGRFF